LLAQAAVVMFYDSASRARECSPVRSFVFSDGYAPLALCYPVAGL